MRKQNATGNQVYRRSLARGWSAGTQSEASGPGEHEADTGEQYADQLSRLQRLCFRSQKAKTVDERRHDSDDEEIEDERLGRTELRGDEGEASDDKRAHHAAGR